MVTVVVTATMGYINADIFYDKKEYYRKNGVFMVVALIAAFAIAILPIEVYTTPGHLYGYGAMETVQSLLALAANSAAPGSSGATSTIFTRPPQPSNRALKPSKSGSFR